MGRADGPRRGPARVLFAPGLLRGAITALLLTAVVAAGAQAASVHLGPAVFATGFTDTQLDNADANVFMDARDAGAGWVRLNAYWAGIAPKHPGHGFQAADPSDPEYNWTTLDAAVRDADASRLRILLTLTDAPAWAEGAHRPRGIVPGSWRPSAGALQAFAQAAATRYAGRFPDPLHPGAHLPEISHFQVWNEPNLFIYLMPQWIRTGRRSFAPASPALYRGMLNAAYTGIKAVQPRSQVLAAGTAPYGDVPGRSRMAPVLFLRELLCLHGRALVRERCPNPAHLDALDHHPYTLRPGIKALLPDDVSVPDLGKLEHVAAVAVKDATVFPRRRKPLWVTEIDWRSDPPARGAISPTLQARYLSQSFYEMWRQGVSHVLWYQVQDSRTVDPNFFGGGVYYAGGRPKPAATAASFPFVVLASGPEAVTVWGRAPTRGSVTILRRAGGVWRALARVPSRADGVFYARVRTSARSLLRAASGTAASLPYPVS